MKNIKKTKRIKYVSFIYKCMRGVIVFLILVGVFFTGVSADDYGEQTGDIGYAELVADESVVHVDDEFYVTLYCTVDFPITSFTIRELTWENDLVELVPNEGGVPGESYNATFPEMMWMLKDDGDVHTGKIVYVMAFNTEEITGHHPYVAFKFRAKNPGNVHFVMPANVGGNPGFEVAISDGAYWNNTNVTILGENGDPGGNGGNGEEPPNGGGDGDGDNGGGGSSPPLPPPNEPPVAVLEETYTGTVGETMEFEGGNSYDTDGEIVTYIWDTGDGADDLCDCSFLEHIYSSPGEYLLRLTVVDNNGSSNNATALVIVNDVEEPPDGDGNDTEIPDTNDTDIDDSEGIPVFAVVVYVIFIVVILFLAYYFFVIQQK